MTNAALNALRQMAGVLPSQTEIVKTLTGYEVRVDGRCIGATASLAGAVELQDLSLSLQRNALVEQQMRGRA